MVQGSSLSLKLFSCMENNHIGIVVKAEKAVAYESPDHLNPWGTARDNSKNMRFNEKVYKIFENKMLQLRVLDIGCSGGGFVKSCIDDNCLAVGIEGSDYSQRWKRAEWRTIPDRLFTGDITAGIDIYLSRNGVEERLFFDLVTCWEVMEHIKEEDIAKVCSNIKKHIAEDGLWIMSVSYIDDIVNGVNLHQTVKQKEWWVKKFSENGFEHIEEYVPYFSEQYIRGVRYGAPCSFHLILTPNKAKAPAVPKLGFFSRVLDRVWYGSKNQKRIKRMLGIA